MWPGISLKSERNNPWFKPWFNILLHTQSIVCATVSGQCLEYLEYITLQEVTKFSFDWNVSEKAYGTSTFNKESWAEWMSQAIQRIKRFFKEMKGKKNFFLNLWPSSFGWLIDFRFFVVLFWIYLVHLEIISTLRKPSMSHHSELIDSRVERLQSGL